MKTLIILTTCASKEEAQKIAARMIEEQLAYCAQVGAEILSVYPWKNQIETEREIPLVLKTLEEKKELLSEKLKQLHSYETPQILVIEADSINQNYSNWARDWVFERKG